MSDPKPTGYMPILGTPFAVRMDLLSEEQAQANHWQSLSRLRERGGLSMCEAAAIAERRRWREQKVSEAAEAIARLAQPEQVAQDAEHAENYRLIRRGQHWSVVDGIGNTLRGEDLDAAVDAIRAARARGEGGRHD